MDDKDQRRRERAYRIWEDEGRVDGAHLDHWQRAQDDLEPPEEGVAAEGVDANADETEMTSVDHGQLYGTLVPQTKP